jgi:hypothetical protein
MPMVRERLASFSRLLVFGHADFDDDEDLVDDRDSGADQDRPW